MDRQHESDAERERRLREAAVTKVTRKAPEPVPPDEREVDEDDDAARARFENKHLWVDLQIRQAMERGEFDNLPGAGKPQDLEPGPADEDARAMWWAMRILRNANVQTDELRYRKQISVLREQVRSATQEEAMLVLLRKHNEVVLRLNSMGTNAIRVPLGPLDEMAELARLRARVAG